VTCEEILLFGLEVKVESIIVIQILNGRLKCPWSVMHIIDLIHAKIKGFEVKFIHTFREERKVLIFWPTIGAITTVMWFQILLIVS